MTRTAALLILGAAVLLAVFGVSAWFAYDVFIPANKGSEVSPAESKPSAPSQAASDKVFNLICEGTNAVPANGFDAPAKVLNQTFVAGINLTAKTGWYQGEIAISEARKGTITINEAGEIVVSRPAMFERHGAMIAGEHFTLNRVTGEFIQAVTLSDKRIVVMIKAYCGKLIKPPF